MLSALGLQGWTPGALVKFIGRILPGSATLPVVLAARISKAELPPPPEPLPPRRRSCDMATRILELLRRYASSVLQRRIRALIGLLGWFGLLAWDIKAGNLQRNG